MSPSDPRDKYVPKHPTPPSGVPEFGVPEFGHKTPVDMQTIREDESTLEGIDRRSRETKNTTIETINRIEALRKETRDDVRKVDSKVDGVIATVSTLRVEVAKHGTQNDAILSKLDELKAHAERSEQVKTITRIAEVEVDTTRQLTDIEIERKRATTEIEDGAAAKAARREVIKAFAIKLIAGLGSLWAIISVSYLSKCGH